MKGDGFLGMPFVIKKGSSMATSMLQIHVASTERLVDLDL